MAITKEQVAQEVERLEATGMGHGKALQLVKQRLLAISEAQQSALAALRDDQRIDVLTAQVSSYINRVERVLRIERTIGR